MPRDRHRGILDNGRKIDLARLPFRRLAGRNAMFDWRFGDGSKVGTSVRFENGGGSLRLIHDDGEQSFRPQGQIRHFGGVQWFAICPKTGRRARVLDEPNGLNRFYTRYVFGRSISYQSQSLDPADRAWRVKHKIKARLIGDLDPDEWDMPPKPKWMRWATYKRYEDRFDRAEELLDNESYWACLRILKAGL